MYQLPLRSSRGWLNHAIGGWQVSGRVFVRGGLPFSVGNSASSHFFNGAGSGRANLVSGENPYTTASIPAVTLPGTIQWLNPNAFQSVTFTNPSSFTASCYPTTNIQNCQPVNTGRN